MLRRLGDIARPETFYTFSTSTRPSKKRLGCWLRRPAQQSLCVSASLREKTADAVRIAVASAFFFCLRRSTRRRGEHGGFGRALRDWEGFQKASEVIAKPLDERSRGTRDPTACVVGASVPLARKGFCNYLASCVGEGLSRLEACSRSRGCLVSRRAAENAERL